MIAVVLLLLAQVSATPVRPAAAGLITGIVRDGAGGAVSGAAVIIRSAGAELQTTSGPDGRFTATTATPAEAILIVRAPGFAEKYQSLAAGAPRENIEIIVEPATVTESVTVTAARTGRRTGDVPASVNVLSRQDIKQSPAVVADDVLRQIPTFSLFRRTSSLAAHPTSQGVSLRGVGPSGVSRTLVLLDGVPFNDPFGGWVYWSRLPLESADRIEVVDGSSSSLYGNYAMGGVINIISRPPAPRAFEIKTQYGSRNSPKLDFLGSDVWGKVGVAVDGSLFDTDGYEIVKESEQGPIDNKSSVQFKNVNVKLDYTPSDKIRAFFRTGYFREERNNGKASSIDGTEEANDTTWTSANGGVQFRLPDRSDLQATFFTDVETFHSNALAVRASTPPRSIGVMTLRQKVPTKGAGGSVQWSRALGSKQFFTAGSDFRWVDGDSEEQGLDAATGTQVTLQRVAGGTQRSLGAFVQDLINPSKDLSITLSARVDSWRNYDGHNLEVNVPSGVPTAGNNPSLPARSDTVASPRVAALYHVTRAIDVWGDVGWGFRAPTLNELYRLFRVGTTLTLANPSLGPERLVGGEAGVTIIPTRDVTIRTTWFDNRVKDPVSNVTLSTGATITQQRQNLGRTHIRGVQMDLDYRFATSFRLAGGYIFNRATVTENPANAALIGKYLPQVPKSRGSARLIYSNPTYATLVVGAQFVGAQFDDDLNSPSRRLPTYTIMDVMASRTVGSNLELFFGVQNLLDREYYVGTLPTTVGSPRFITGGVRVRFAGR